MHRGCKEVSFARTDNRIAGVGDRVCRVRWHIIYDPVKTFVSHFPLTEYRSNHDFRISVLISCLKATTTQIWLKFVCINGYIHLLWMLGKCVLPPLWGSQLCSCWCCLLACYWTCCNCLFRTPFRTLKWPLRTIWLLFSELGLLVVHLYSMYFLGWKAFSVLQEHDSHNILHVCIKEGEFICSLLTYVFIHGIGSICPLYTSLYLYYLRYAGWFREVRKEVQGFKKKPLRYMRVRGRPQPTYKVRHKLLKKDEKAPTRSLFPIKGTGDLCALMRGSEQKWWWVNTAFLLDPVPVCNSPGCGGQSQSPFSTFKRKCQSDVPAADVS